MQLVEMTKRHILNSMKQDFETLKEFENAQTAVSKLRKMFLESPDSQLSAEQVGELIHNCAEENLKTLSKDQRKMITPEALKHSPLRNPLACMLALSEVMRFGKFEDITSTLQSYTEDCKTVEDVIRLSVENWKKSYDVATVEGLLVPLLLAENGITTSSLNEYAKNPGQGQSSEIKRF